MSKITFRADDALIARIEAMDASKSEVMREALHSYFDDHSSEADSLDALITDRIDQHLAERLDHEGSDVAIAVSTEDDEPADTQSDESDRFPESTSSVSNRCDQCGRTLDSEHAYCPNCGRKAVNTRCECGDELHSDWAFCPNCGRRTPAADVLDE